jgi:hypothetical protein
MPDAFDYALDRAGTPRDVNSRAAVRRVYDEIVAGIKCRRELRDATGLDYAVIVDSVEALKLAGLIQSVETVTVDYYRQAGSTEEPPRPGRDLPPPPEPPSDKRQPEPPKENCEVNLPRVETRRLLLVFTSSVFIIERSTGFAGLD